MKLGVMVVQTVVFSSLGTIPITLLIPASLFEWAIFIWVCLVVTCVMGEAIKRGEL